MDELYSAFLFFSVIGCMVAIFAFFAVAKIPKAPNYEDMVWGSLLIYFFAVGSLVSLLISGIPDRAEGVVVPAIFLPSAAGLTLGFFYRWIKTSGTELSNKT